MNTLVKEQWPSGETRGRQTDGHRFVELSQAMKSLLLLPHDETWCVFFLSIQREVVEPRTVVEPCTVVESCTSRRTLY